MAASRAPITPSPQILAHFIRQPVYGQRQLLSLFRFPSGLVPFQCRIENFL
jgi:hypothetical protein